LVDEEFWKLDLFKEVEGDEEYTEEKEEEDVVDDDFDAPELPDEPIETPVTEKSSKKRSGYVDPAVAAKKQKTPRTARPKVVAVNSESKGPPSTLTSPPSLRKSQRLSEMQSAIEHEYKPTRPSPRPQKRQQVELRRLTQAELLKEAEQTEVDNLQSLVDLQRLTEEKKPRPVVETLVVTDPVVSFYSRGPMNLVTFSGTNEFPSFINQPTAPPYPTLRNCTVTGVPAKYTDPKTGLPFATILALKKLREK